MTEIRDMFLLRSSFRPYFSIGISKTKFSNKARTSIIKNVIELFSRFWQVWLNLTFLKEIYHSTFWPLSLWFSYAYAYSYTRHFEKKERGDNNNINTCSYIYVRERVSDATYAVRRFGGKMFATRLDCLLILIHERMRVLGLKSLIRFWILHLRILKIKK